MTYLGCYPIIIINCNHVLDGDYNYDIFLDMKETIECIFEDLDNKSIESKEFIELLQGLSNDIGLLQTFKEKIDKFLKDKQ